MDAITQQLSILLIMVALVLTIVATQFMRIRQRKKTLPLLRHIPAYEALPNFVGLAIEANRPLHLSFGSSGIGGDSTLASLVSAELFYQIAQRAAIGDAAPVITLSDASVLPLGQDILRRAYQTRDRFFNYSQVRWLPTGQRSLTFAAAVTALLGDDRISANVYAGQFGAELALMMEAGLRRDLPSVAVSDNLEGQAIAYAFSDHLLVGEEVFAAGAYLSKEPSQFGAIVSGDVLRWLLVATLFISMLIALRNGA